MEKVIGFPNSDSIETEACAWIAQLDGDREPSAEDIAALREWLTRSPLHRQELQRLAALWGDLNMLTELAPALESLATPSQPTATRKLFSPLLATRAFVTACATALVLLAGSYYWAEQERSAPTHHLYTTQIGEQRIEQLPDGSSVQLNTASHVEIDFSAGLRKVRLIKGEAHFKVAHDKNRPFEVFAGNGMVRAVGTAFSVYLDNQKVEVTVTEGRVEVETSIDSPAQPSQPGSQPTERPTQKAQLRAGQNIRFNHSAEPIQTLKDDEVARKLSWRDDGVLSVTVLIDGQGLQFDMATYTLEHLMDAGIDPKRIDYLFFTHLHADHILGYPEYAFMRSVWGATEPARVSGPIGTGNMVAGARQFNSVHVKALPEFMENVLSEGKNTGAQVEGIRRGFDSEVKEIDGGGVVLETDAFTVTATPVLHSVPSFAFRVDSRYGSVVVSGDTAPSLNVVDLAMNADVLIHEATLSELSWRGMNNIKLSEGLRSDYEKNRSGHTSTVELGKIARRAKVKKLVAYHLPTFASELASQQMLKTQLSSAPFSSTLKADHIAAIKRYYKDPLYLAEPMMVIKVGD
jgi:transmembrane sensor